jgi:hypothetical protein
LKTAIPTTLAALLAATALAAPASAATPAERKQNAQIKTLQRQVKTLQKQVKTLQSKMRVVENVSAGGIIFTACTVAATADAFQGTWEALDRHAAHNAHGLDQFPAQTPIADPLNSCQGLEIQRQANPAAIPTTNVFAALLNIFR